MPSLLSETIKTSEAIVADFIAGEEGRKTTEMNYWSEGDLDRCEITDIYMCT